VGFLLVAVFLLLFWPVEWNGKDVARRSASLSNLKQIALGHAQYVADHDGFGPVPDNWMDQLSPYLKQEEKWKFVAPIKGRTEGEYGYAYYRPLGDVKVWAVQNKEEVVLAFESSDLSWNANGGLELLPDPPRWRGSMNNFAYLDGHANGRREPPKFEIVLPE